jgi:hypothetical protein
VDALVEGPGVGAAVGCRDGLLRFGLGSAPSLPGAPLGCDVGDFTALPSIGARVFWTGLALLLVVVGDSVTWGNGCDSGSFVGGELIVEPGGVSIVTCGGLFVGEDVGVWIGFAAG